MAFFSLDFVKRVATVPRHPTAQDILDAVMNYCARESKNGISVRGTYNTTYYIFEFTPAMLSSPYFSDALTAINKSFAGYVKYTKTAFKTCTPGTYCFMQRSPHNCTFICIREGCNNRLEPCGESDYDIVSAIYICVYDGCQ